MGNHGKEKDRSLRTDLKNAQDAQDNAMKMKAEYEDALRGAKQESAQIIENARSAAKERV